MSDKITITGRAAVLVSQHTGFDPTQPDNTKAHEFVFVRETAVVDGKITGCWAGDYRWVGWAEIKVEINSKAEMLDAHVKALEVERARVLADAQLAVTRIDGELQRLLSIELTP